MSSPERGPGAVGRRRDHGRRVAEVARPLERGHDERARAVDLDRAVVGAERLDHERRREVRRPRVERPATHAPARSPPRTRAARPRRRRGRRPLARLEQEAVGPHRDVHEVGVVADRVAARRAAAVELHGADAGPLAAVQRPEARARCAPGRSRPPSPPARRGGTAPGRRGRGRPTKRNSGHGQRGGHGLARHRVVHRPEAGDAVDLAGGEAGVVERVGDAARERGRAPLRPDSRENGV